MAEVDCIDTGGAEGAVEYTVGWDTNVENVCSLSQTAGSKKLEASSIQGKSSLEFGVIGICILDISPLVEDRASMPPRLAGYEDLDIDVLMFRVDRGICVSGRRAVAFSSMDPWFECIILVKFIPCLFLLHLLNIMDKPSAYFLGKYASGKPTFILSKCSLVLSTNESYSSALSNSPSHLDAVT
jgi:hypothetical protein